MEKRNAAWVGDGFGVTGGGRWTRLERTNQPNRTGSGSMSSKQGPGHVSHLSQTSRNDALAPTNMIKSNARGGTSRSNNLGENVRVTQTLGSTSSNKRVEGRRLTQAEIQDHTRRGVCFKCEEMWGPKHCCKVAQLQILVVDDNVEWGNAEVENVPNEEEEEKEREEALRPSIYSVLGLSSNQSMQL